VLLLDCGPQPHARWEEIGIGDMAPVIELTKELIGAHLA
jgi:hypothetical protein